jgi:tripartite-type tricarboxylate transporter receptor subunit TctC
MHASRISRRAWIATLASTLPALATAQAPYPDRPITLVVPNAAGGAADNLARSVADELGKRLKQSVVVENLGGASGAIAAQKVLRAAPDGYTLLFGTTSDMVVTPIANRAAGYAAKDFTPIGKVGTTPMTLVARPNLGVSTADQMAALAKQKPNGLSIGTTGNASLQAFAAVALQRAAGIDLLGVPVQGWRTDGDNDLLAGQIDLGVMTLPAAMTHVRAGKLVLLGVLSQQARGRCARDAHDQRVALVQGRGRRDLGRVGRPARPAGTGGGPPEPGPAGPAERQATSTSAAAKLGDTAVPYAPPAEFGRFLLAEDERYRCAGHRPEAGMSDLPCGARTRTLRAANPCSCIARRRPALPLSWRPGRALPLGVRARGAG